MKHIVTAIVAVAVAGCQPPICEPGETQSCLCPDELQGAQVCNLKGNGWEGCQCQDPPGTEKASAQEVLEKAANRHWSGTSAPTGTGLHGTAHAADGSEGPPEVVVEEPSLATDLAPAVVKKVVRSHLDEIRKCYDGALASDPELGGKVVVSFSITAQGKVKGQKVSSSTLESDAVQSCILDEVKTWTFPEPDGGDEVAVTYPFIFKSVS